jgi:MoaA/NifB/PqqE/SkfB family radical SAM enzyme
VDCAGSFWPSNDEFVRNWGQRLIKQRVPVTGSIALTHRCNLRCAHCYLGPLSARDVQVAEELSTIQVCSILDDATEAGCLFLLLTGGEPLLRKDFADIYRHAKLNGLMVTVFTNATLIDDGVLQLFDELPPRGVEVTIYGASAAVYERIAGVKGSYQRSRRGIEQLLEHGVNVRLKTVLMGPNRGEFTDMERLAKDYGVDFRFDAAIFPRLDGDKSPLRLRVSPQEAVANELADRDRMSTLCEYFDRMQGVSVPDSLYCCGAGVTSFHIDPYGNLQPCLMTHKYQYNVLGGSFDAGWRRAILASSAGIVKSDRCVATARPSLTWKWAPKTSRQRICVLWAGFGIKGSAKSTLLEGRDKHAV